LKFAESNEIINYSMSKKAEPNSANVVYHKRKHEISMNLTFS